MEPAPNEYERFMTEPFPVMAINRYMLLEAGLAQAVVEQLSDEAMRGIAARMAEASAFEDYVEQVKLAATMYLEWGGNESS